SALGGNRERCGESRWARRGHRGDHSSQTPELWRSKGLRSSGQVLVRLKRTERTAETIVRARVRWLTSHYSEASRLNFATPLSHGSTVESALRPLALSWSQLSFEVTLETSGSTNTCLSSRLYKSFSSDTRTIATYFLIRRPSCERFREEKKSGII